MKMNLLLLLMSLSIIASSCKSSQAAMEGEADLAGWPNRRTKAPDGVYCFFHQSVSAGNNTKIPAGLIILRQNMPASWGAPWPKDSRPNLNVRYIDSLGNAQEKIYIATLDGAKAKLRNGITYDFPVISPENEITGRCSLSLEHFNGENGVIPSFSVHCSLQKLKPDPADFRVVDTACRGGQWYP